MWFRILHRTTKPNDLCPILQVIAATALRRGNQQREEDGKRLREQSERLQRLEDSRNPFYEAVKAATVQAIEARKHQRDFDVQTHKQEISNRLGDLLTALRECGLSNRLDDLDMTQMLAHYQRQIRGWTPPQVESAFAHAADLLRRAISTYSFDQVAEDLCDLDLRPLQECFNLLVGMVSGYLLFPGKDEIATLAAGGSLACSCNRMATRHNSAEL